MVITLIQHDILWQQPDENRRLIASKIEEIPPCDIIVLPETFTTGFGEGMARLAEPPVGETLLWSQEIARERECLVVGSWIVRNESQCYNRLHWVYSDGRWGYYDKAHLFRAGGEAAQLNAGRERPIFEWRGWKIRPAVCYDLRFPTWLRNRNMEYDMLLFCANWPKGRIEAWETLLKARAIENQCYVVGCNRRGIDNDGTVYPGQSCIFDYKGKSLTPDTPTNNELLTATLDYEKQAQFRQRWPFYLDAD